MASWSERLKAQSIRRTQAFFSSTCGRSLPSSQMGKLTRRSDRQRLGLSAKRLGTLPAKRSSRRYSSPRR